MNTNSKILRHMVLFGFKESTTNGEIKKIENEFVSLKEKIKLIDDFEWGKNVSPENSSQGYTHCFLLSFKSEEERDQYLPHPYHQEFSALLKPYLEKVLVIDYWTE